MEAAVLRVKRKRGADPAEALLISCKRLRAEEENRDPNPVTKQLFRLAATVTSQDEPVQQYVHEALSRDRAAQTFNPSAGSLQRIQKDLRSVKETERQESRYRLISNLRPKCDDQDSGAGTSQPASPETDQKPVLVGEEAAASTNPECPVNAHGSFQVFDMVHEEAEKEEAERKESHPETITCNSVKMVRELLTLSDEGRGVEHRENPDEFVYDIYYAESSTNNWIQDILSVQPYSCEQELVPEDPEPEETYEDEDDENEENNWRNDYPDEEGEDDSDREERYRGYYEDSDDENGHRGDPWKEYRQRAMRELDEEEDYD